MRPHFSEFSYGFGIIHEYVGWHHSYITACPVFPSLYKEGKKGGGYDAMIRLPNISPIWPNTLLSKPFTLIFLQFKLSHYLRRRDAREAGSKEINVPYYRMKLSADRKYHQHRMLLELEKEESHPIVSYVTPEFYTSDDINDAFLKKEICERSRWFKPFKINDLSDPNHCVAFELDGHPYVFSEPSRLDNKGTFKEFEKSVADSLKNKSQDKPQPDALERTASYISNIIKETVLPSDLKLRDFLREELARRHPLYRIAFYSQYFLGSQLFIVNKKIDEKILREKVG